MNWPPSGSGTTPTGTGFVHVTGGSQDGAAAAPALSDLDPSCTDAAAGTASLRTLGTGAQQAAAGNDSRLSDSRTPTGSAGGALGGTYPNPSCAGRFLGRTVKTSGSGTFTTQARTNTIKVTLLAGGGAGGGGATASSSGAAGGGGSSGGYAEKVFAVSPSTGYSYAVGAGGTAGTAGNNPGNPGGNSTFGPVSAVTVTANGGLGGQGMAAAATVAYALGGASPSVSTNGDVNGTGAPGENGARNTAALMCAGAGASSPYGGGGNARTTHGAGNNATGFGSGGGGGACISAGGNVAGGTGSGGLIVIDEYE